MKKLMLLGSALLLSTSAFAGLLVDGNLADWGVKRTGQASDWTPSSGIHHTVEDQTGGSGSYLNPGYGGQGYDAEAIYATFQGNRLFVALATGHNPLTVNNPAGNSYGAGDFAIDFGRNGSYEMGINHRYMTPNGLEAFGVQGGVYKNPGWAYGLWNSSSAYAPNQPDTTRPTSMTAGTYLGMADFAFTTIGQNGYGAYRNDLHYFYEFSLDVSLLYAAGWDGKTAFNIQWTENCANDAIIVDPPGYVPAPATLALLPFGLLGLIRRRRPAHQK